MAGLGRESAYGPCADESPLGSVLRTRSRAHARGFRFPGRIAIASGPARLAGRRVREAGLVAEKNAQTHRDERDVSAIQPRDAGTARPRPAEHFAGARTAISTGGRNGP